MTYVELSQNSSSSESRPSTAASRITLIPNAVLRREKLVKSLNDGRQSSAGYVQTRRESLKSADVGSSKGGWVASGTEEMRSSLTPSLFSNVASTIHFAIDGERGVNQFLQLPC